MKSKMAMLLLLPFLNGCVTGAGAKWYAPATWFSHHAANVVDDEKKKVESNEQKLTDSQKSVVHSAHVEIFKSMNTPLPESKGGELLFRFGHNGLRLLDTIDTISGEEINTSLEVIKGLLSEETKKREMAEKKQSEAETTNESISKKYTECASDLSLSRKALSKAQDELRNSFERENQLANEARSFHAKLYILGLVAFLLLCAWVYCRCVLGGYAPAIGRVLALVHTKEPALSDKMTGMFDSVLNRYEQLHVKEHVGKELATLKSAV